MATAVGRRALGRRVLELHRCDDVAGIRIDHHERPDGTAVVGENDLVVRLVEHDAVEAAALDFDLLEDGQRLQIEHRDGAVATVRREAVARLGCDADAVDAWCVLEIRQYPFPVAPSTTITCVLRDTKTRPWSNRRKRSRCRRRP